MQQMQKQQFTDKINVEQYQLEQEEEEEPYSDDSPTFDEHLDLLGISYDPYIVKVWDEEFDFEVEIDFGEGTTKILAKDSSIPLGANSLPLSNGSAAIGNSDRYAKEDHIHPSDQSKQDKLVSGESIKTINNQSLLGEGNIITPDSKVTSAANHYTPEGGTITAGTIINSITKDEKGHIIGIKTANGLDASKITSGTINIERLPNGALERLVIVANQTARFALTTADVQEGDTVKQSDTGVMYFVINSTKLDNEAGYSVYTAGAATSVPWSGVTNAPTKVSQFTNDAGYLTSVPAQT